MHSGCSFRDRPYEVIEHCPRVNVHAEVISDDEVLNWLPITGTGGTVKSGTVALTSYRNVFCLAVMDKQLEFILSAESL